jgi:hypothetical protein
VITPIGVLGGQYFTKTRQLFFTKAIPPVGARAPP